MTVYVKTVQVGLKLPIGLFNELIYIMNEEQKWNSPQQFIQDALNEKIDRWKREHPPKV